MNKCHLLTNNQYGQREEIPCEDLLSGLVAYGQRIEYERAALREATPTEFGNAYFFIAIYDGGRQVSWTVRFLHDGGEWEETTSWRFNGENELVSSSGKYEDSGSFGPYPRWLETNLQPPSQTHTQNLTEGVATHHGSPHRIH